MIDETDSPPGSSRLYHASSRVSQALIEARSAEAAAQEICRRLVADGGFALAWIGQCPGGAGKTVPVGWNGTKQYGPQEINALVAGGPAAEVRAAGKPTVANKCADKKTGAASAAAFPIRCGGGVTGVLSVYRAEPDFFGAGETAILEEMAANISTGLEHLEMEARQNAELGKERSLLRALMDNSLDLVYFKDQNSNFIRCSKAMCERFGVSPEEVVGKSDFDFFGEEHAREAFADEQTIIRTGRGIAGKIERETWKQGVDTWVLTAKMPLRNDAGEIVGTVGISKDFTAIKEAESKLEEMHKQLLDVSRMAGMAEVATNILHNVGNVLNSVNVSCSVVSEKVRKSKIENVTKAAALFQENAADLPGFFASPKGAQLPPYLSALATHLLAERDEVLRELASLATNIEHIKEIVAAQQSYARTAGVVESIHIPAVVDDALHMHKDAMGRHEVHIIREYSETPPVMVDKHKVLQILVNLIHNAKYALDEGRPEEKKVIIRVERNGDQGVRISVIDNGVGIAPANLARIFEHGFTTRKGGHGFGLHSGALTAKELGGTLTARSDGPGKGAVFILDLPNEPRKAAR